MTEVLIHGDETTSQGYHAEAFRKAGGNITHIPGSAIVKLTLPAAWRIVSGMEEGIIMSDKLVNNEGLKVGALIKSDNAARSRGCKYEGFCVY